MIVELFVLGGIAFWILSGVVFLLLLWAASDDRAIASAILLALYLVGIYLFGNAGDASIPPWVFYIGIPSYFAIGTLWGIAKWYLFVSRHTLTYRSLRQEFLVHSGIHNATLDTPVPENLRRVWKNRRRPDASRPIARFHKRRIISWMCFWPSSMVWSVIDEPWRRIYNGIATLLQKIADRAYEKAGVDEDLRVPEETEIEMDAVTSWVVVDDQKH